MGARAINEAGLRLIEGYERTPPASVDGQGNVHPYLDPVLVWTIGWGHAISSQGRHLAGERDRGLATSLYPVGLTLDEAAALLRADLLAAQLAVQQLVTVSLSDNEFAALVSFTFNLGAGHLRSSTLLRLLDANDHFGAALQFGRWVLANGKPLAGLVARRRDERDLFLTPDA